MHLLDDRVVAARVEERAPVAARRLEVVLAAGGVGEHAVDVDDDRRPGLDRPVAPGPVLGDVAGGRSLVVGRSRSAR